MKHHAVFAVCFTALTLATTCVAVGHYVNSLEAVLLGMAAGGALAFVVGIVGLWGDSTHHDEPGEPVDDADL